MKKIVLIVLGGLIVLAIASPFESRKTNEEWWAEYHEMQTDRTRKAIMAFFEKKDAEN